MSFHTIIMAAGKGTRMKSLAKDKTKVTFPIFDKPLIQYVIDAAKSIENNELIVVVGHGGEEVKNIVGKQGEVVWQLEQKGTGHAVQIAAKSINNDEGDTLILCGDTPLIQAKTLQNVLNLHKSEHNDITLVSAIIDEPNYYGKIVRDANGCVTKIVEDKDTTKDEKNIKEVNSGIYLLSNRVLKTELGKLKPNNAQGELYLTDIVLYALQDKYKVGAYIMDDQLEMIGINDRVQLASAEKTMRHAINQKLMLSGVTIEDPENTYISPEVTIDADTVINPGTHILGKTNIGSGNVIGPNAYIKSSSIGNDNVINPQTVILDSRLGSSIIVEPLSYLNDVEIHDSTVVKVGSIWNKEDRTKIRKN